MGGGQGGGGWGWGLVVRGNYVWCLAIVTKSKGLGGPNR